MPSFPPGYTPITSEALRRTTRFFPPQSETHLRFKVAGTQRANLRLRHSNTGGSLDSSYSTLSGAIEVTFRTAKPVKLAYKQYPGGSTVEETVIGPDVRTYGPDTLPTYKGDFTASIVV